MDKRQAFVTATRLVSDWNEGNSSEEIAERLMRSPRKVTVLFGIIAQEEGLAYSGSLDVLMQYLDDLDTAEIPK